MSSVSAIRRKSVLKSRVRTPLVPSTRAHSGVAEKVKPIGEPGPRPMMR